MTNTLLKVICEQTYGAPEDDPEGGCHCGINCNRDANERCPVEEDVDRLMDGQVAHVAAVYGLDDHGADRSGDRAAFVSAVIDGDIEWDAITSLIPLAHRRPGCEEIPFLTRLDEEVPDAGTP